MEDTVIEQPVVETPVEVVAEPVVEEKIHVYQPTDEMGRPMGGKQVIKYKTHEELVEKIQEQNVLLIRKLREQTRKTRLGIPDEDDDVPETAPRVVEEIEFNPRALSDDERVTLSRNLLDPDKFQEAADTLFEATLGAKPDKLRATLSQLQQNAISERAQAEVAAFISSNPDYVVCAENSTAITNWMTRKNLSPVQGNFQLAYNTLRKAGIMVERVSDTPVQEAVVEQVTPPVEEPVKVEPKPAPQPVVPGIGSGFTRSESSNAGTPQPSGADIVYEIKVSGQVQKFYGLAAVNAMSSDEYKRRINNEPGFAAKVDKLEKEAASRRRR